MAGDADFTAFLAGEAPSTKIDAQGTRITRYPTGQRQLIVGIIKNTFPEYVNNVNTKVTNEDTISNAHAEYGGLGGDTIKAQNIAPYPQMTEIIRNNKKSSIGGASTPEIMGDVGDLLHELYHGRTATQKIGNYTGPNLGKDWKSMLKDAEEAGFPGVGSGIGGGDNIEEFLASAVPVTQIRAMGMTPQGRYKDMPKELDKLHTKYPWLKGFINEHAAPERIKETARALSPSLIDRLSDLINPKSKK